MKAVIAIIVVIILAAGAYALFMRPSGTAPTQMATSTDMGTMDMGTSSDTTSGSTGVSTGVSVGATATTGSQIVVVTYTDSGFSPSTITVAEGQTVEFINKSANGMWVASNPHPVHTGYDGTSMQTHCAAGYAGAAPFDECSSASTFSFTFNKVGSWGYHNHLAPNMMGTVVVTASAASGTN